LEGIEIKANPERHISKRKANMEGTIIKEKLTQKDT